MNLIVDIALRATVVLGLAWLAAALLHRASADVRGRIWRTALAATALLFIPVPVPEPLRISSAALADATGASNGAVTAAPILLTIWMARAGARPAGDQPGCSHSAHSCGASIPRA